MRGAATPKVPLISSPGEVPGGKRAYDNFVERRHFPTHLSLLFTVSFPCLLGEAVIEIVRDISTYGGGGNERERERSGREDTYRRNRQRERGGQRILCQTLSVITTPVTCVTYQAFSTVFQDLAPPQKSIVLLPVELRLSPPS